MGKGSGSCDERTALITAVPAVDVLTIADLRRGALAWNLQLPGGESVAIKHRTAAAQPGFFVDCYWNAKGGILYSSGHETISQQDTQYPISLLDGVRFNSGQAAVQAVSQLVGEQVRYSLTGIGYSAEKETEHYSLGFYTRRARAQCWYATAEIIMRPTGKVYVFPQSAYRTRQDTLAAVNEYVVRTLQHTQQDID